MDTRGKTNAEFRNEVNKILARHESNFDQVNIALQVVLTELQALRTFHSQNTSPSETNPIARDESSHQHTSHSNTINDHSHQHLKLSFPKFNGDDSTRWIYKAEQYFEFKNILPELQVQLASFHLEDIALQWNRWLTKFREPLTWDEFTKAVQLRFGPTDYKDPSEALNRLKETTSVVAYQEVFKRLSHQVDGLPERFLIGCFIAGLRDDIRIDVKIKQPRTLVDTIGVARLIEARNQLQRRPNLQLLSQPTFETLKVSSNPIAGVLGPPPTQRINQSFNTQPATFRQITNQEARERREKGLCYYCNEKVIIDLIQSSSQQKRTKPEESKSCCYTYLSKLSQFLFKRKPLGKCFYLPKPFLSVTFKLLLKDTRSTERERSPLILQDKDNDHEFRKGSEESATSHTVDGFVDYRGHPANKLNHGGVKPAIFVLGLVALESMVFIGTAVNLVTYLYLDMHYGVSDAANVLTNFMGTTFLLSLVGGFISDAYLTRIKTILVFGTIEFFGLLLLTIQAHDKSLQPPLCMVFDPTAHCPHIRGQKAAVLFSGLYLTALGSGGVKATMPTLGADQFDENDPKERKLISTFFNFYLFAAAFGSSLGVTFLVWIQNNKGWDKAFAISSALILLGLIVVSLGYTCYRNKIPTGSPLTKILQVLVAAFKNRKLHLPDGESGLFEKKSADNLPHTNQFKFLDKAAVVSPNNAAAKTGWQVCTVTRVEEVKILIRMAPIFASTILMNTCLAQLQTFSVQQGTTMDKSLGKFDIPPASLPIIPTAFLVILVPIYDKLFVPFARRLTGHETGLTQLQRVGVGLVLATVSMSTAAIVEIKRKDVAEDHNLVLANPLVTPIPMSVFMLSFQYFIFGIADLFTFVGLLEFFYSQAPMGFRSLGTAFSWCTFALGYYFSSVLVNVVNSATKNSTASRGWLKGNNINTNHLDLFYWTLALLNVVNFINYLFWAKWYKYRGMGSTGTEGTKLTSSVTAKNTDSSSPEDGK
ncbi:protein NRT1/ PTR FAMILY 4.5-like [Aristolochia californica]|uniref:protein NRT1/ PTR FAMILY 4.5-like n=1 Tax=Aristolochia californica TaxID=171875 RepID=UPI0035D7E333